MINLRKALQIAAKEKKKLDAEFDKTGMDIILEDYYIDCADYYHFPYRIIDRKTGKNLISYGGDPAINVTKKCGRILQEQWYFPGSDYWNAIHNGKKIGILENNNHE